MKGLALHWQVIIGLIVGMVYAWMSVTFGWNQFTLDYITPFGDIFINLLKLIAVPLVLFSIISGVTCDAADNTKQHQGHSNELQEVDEDVSKGCDVVQCELVPSESDAHPSVHHSHDQSNDYLPVQCESLHVRKLIRGGATGVANS